MLKKIIMLFLLCLYLSVPILANQGTGAIIKEDCVSYSNSKGEKEEYKITAGTFCAFWKGMNWGEYKSENGYIRVTLFENNDYGTEKMTWVLEDKLEFFFFPCMQSSVGFLQTKQNVCVPVQVKGFQHQWNLEFKVAAKSKCKEFGIEPPKTTVISIITTPLKTNTTTPNQPVIDK